MNSSDINEHLISPNVIYANERQCSEWIGWKSHIHRSRWQIVNKKRMMEWKWMRTDTIYFFSHWKKSLSRKFSHIFFEFYERIHKYAYTNIRYLLYMCVCTVNSIQIYKWNQKYILRKNVELNWSHIKRRNTVYFKSIIFEQFVLFV